VVPDQRSTGCQGQSTRARQPDPCQVHGTREGPQGGQSASRAPGSQSQEFEAVASILTPQSCPKKPPARPELLRDVLRTLYRMRDSAVELRAEDTDAGADFRTRLSWACVIATIDGWIAEVRRKLTAMARRGLCGKAVMP
jgi:hypothetical protein